LHDVVALDQLRAARPGQQEYPRLGRMPHADRAIGIDCTDAGGNTLKIATSTMFSQPLIDAQITPLATPTIDTLSEFGAVVVWSNFPFGDPNGVGNVLADFVDQGGGVVIATYAFSSIWRLTGRITGPGYSPFNHFNNPTDTSGMIDFASSNTAHPIMAGVTQTQSYFENSNYTNPELTAGATLIAVDTAGNRVVAVNENERIVGISIFPGTFLPEGIARLFANAVNFLR